MVGTNIQIVHFFNHDYLEEDKSMIHSSTVTFRAKYLTDMVTSFPLYETFSLVKYNTLRQSKIYKNHFENSDFWGMWPKGHVGQVTCSFINMLFISMGILDDKLAHKFVGRHYCKFHFSAKLAFFRYIIRTICYIP